MALSNVTFSRSDGNLRSPLIGSDHISGLLFDTPTQPSGLTEGTVAQIFSVKDAEKLGILPFVKDSAESVFEKGLPHLHISEFFRINPNGSLYIMCANCASNFKAIEVMQRSAQGSIRQLGVWTPKKLFTGTDSTYTLNLVSDISAIAEGLASNNQPLSILLQANAAGISTNETSLINIPECQSGDYPRVTLLLGQGHSKQVQDIQFARTAHEVVGWIGAAMGIVSLAAVNESPAWVAKFNMMGGEMQSVAMGFGDITVKDDALTSVLPYESLSRQQLDELDDKGYVFPVQYPDKYGTYFSKDKTCSTGDYRMINRNRTIDKSRREVRKVLLNMLNSSINVDPKTGQIATADIKVYKSLVEGVLNAMQSAGEVSGFTVIIDPKQNVLETDTLEIKYRLVPKGVVSDILVEEGFALSTQTA